MLLNQGNKSKLIKTAVFTEKRWSADACLGEDPWSGVLMFRVIYANSSNLDVLNLLREVKLGMKLPILSLGVGFLEASLNQI